jgi:DNA-binding MarR family transcriptional regulator
MGVDPLSWQVFTTLKRSIHLSRQLLMRRTADKGGHPAQAGCLLVIAHREGITQRELADTLHLAPASVTTMLQRMERQGVIERWNDEVDQRLTRIRLTEEGARLNAQLAAVSADVIAATISPLSAHDRAELIRILNLLADNTAAELERLDA